MDTKEKQPNNEIGSTVEIRFTNIPGSVPLKGKVDTGADISSLHATEHQIQDGRVTFICKELSHNKITVPVISQQTVKSADGGHEYRPVIELNVKVNGKLLTNVQFNLNDRGNMSFPVLIGKNILLKGNFKIDPRLDENEEHQLAFNTSETPNTKHNPKIIHVYKVNEETTNEMVDTHFTQNFSHIHIGNDTYLVRYLGYTGTKLNPVVDSDEILYLLDQIKNNLDDEDKEQLRKDSIGEVNGND